MSRGTANRADAAVFVSYAQDEDGARALDLADRLEAAGVSVWIAGRSIQGAQNYGPEVVEAIEACQVLVLLASAASLGSGHVAVEMQMAFEAGKPRLPLRLDDTPFPSQLRYWLTGVNWIDVRGPDEDWLPKVMQALEHLGVAAGGAPPVAAEPPAIRYAQSGDLSIAYQVFGDGPFDLVFVPGFISHCDLLSQLPFARTLFERLGSFARVITFDKRGTGLSERTLGFGTAEDRMDDIRAVMDAAGSERAALVGISEGGPLTVLFAATYPERTIALVPWATFARLLQAPDYPYGSVREAALQLIDAIVEGWGSGEMMRMVLARQPTDPETNLTLARLERSAATPKMVGEILRSNFEIDIRGALSSVTAPTLVIHRSDDYVVPTECGRFLAEHIKGARFLELPGDWHLNGSAGGEDDAVDALEEFLTGRPHEVVEVDRVLKTVVFTDVVGSTEQAAALGDRHWHELLDTHDMAVRRQLERFRGEEVKTTGDGFLAAFDGPGRAIACARAITASSRDLGLEVRAGLHTGECERRGDDLAGIAVHIGARVASLAGAGEVLVTSTVRDLVVGSDVEFVDRGRHALKGIPGEWQVLALAS